MASLLTATGRQSIPLYLFLMALFSLGASYLVTFRKPSLQDSFHLQAFKLNYAAFNNGIRFAKVRFIAREQKQSNIDVWSVSQVNTLSGLDYNQYGFPIGTDITSTNQQLPETDEQCRQVWQFVLGPLQPKIFLSTDDYEQIHQDAGYWAKITPDNICLYHSSQVNQFVIRYNARSGEVLLMETQ